MKYTKPFITALLIIITVSAYSQEINNDSISVDSASKKKKADVPKTGLKVVPVPDLRFDPYTGIRIGAVVFLTDFGDGARYPNFYSNTILEASYGTKGATNIRARYKRYGDIIFYGEVNYQDQIAAPYFGINGYQQSYNEEHLNLQSLELNSPKHPFFYNYAVRSIQLNFELQDTIKGTTNLNWLGSIYSGWHDVKEVDLKKLNKGVDSDSDEYIPDTAVTLYNLNKQWGITDENKLEGGKFYTTIKGEIIYDKRDRITNPLKGILSRVGLGYLPRFSKNSYGNVLIANASHTQYIPLVKGKVFKTSFAYRLRYLGYFGGNMPYNIQEGIGGLKSAWGVHRNRAMARQWSSAQFELRTKGFSIKSLDFWGAPFFHTGYVIEEEQLDLSAVSQLDKDTYFNEDYGRWYSSYGYMGKMVINKNVVLGFDIAFPANKETGPSNSMFIGMGFSFRY